MYGWTGQVAYVDLSRGTIVYRPLEKATRKKFLGGRGINMQILFGESPEGIVDPFDARNPLVFGAGPLAGTPVPCSSRYNVSARRSPMNMSFGDSNSGGFWAAELKFAGFDVISVSGKAKKPVYLWVNDGKIEIKDASHLSGKTTWETEDMIRKDHADRDIEIASIGPAGENLVRYAAIINDLTRAAGRCGMGAVMGSKNLKAVAVRGTKSIEIAKPEEFDKIRENAISQIENSAHYRIWSKQGTLMLVELNNLHGSMTSYNSQTSHFDKADTLYADYVERYWVKNKGCFNCPIHCSHFCLINEGPFKGLCAEGLEFNTTYDFGANLGNSYWPAILKSHVLCSQLGLDTDGTGFSIAFAMECYEKGILTENDTDGLSLEWGNNDAIHTLIRKIAFKEGFGKVLCEGPKIASQKIGHGADKFQHTIKGMPLFGDMRGRQSWALACALSTRGPDHLRGAPGDLARANPEFLKKLGLGIKITPETEDKLTPMGKASVLIWSEHLCAVADCVGICKFATQWSTPDDFGIKEIANLLSAVTGVDFGVETVLKIGERVYNLERVMNALDGITRADDVLPRRQHEPVPSGPVKGAKVDPDLFEKAKDEYYKERQWDLERGWPTPPKLRELGLDEADRLLRRKN